MSATITEIKKVNPTIKHTEAFKQAATM